MSRLNPSLLVLDKGLNLQSPKITATPGTVSDSVNYEQVDFQGQKRIDGLARYDGSKLATIDDFILVDPSSITSVPYNDRVLAYNGDKLLGIKANYSIDGHVLVYVLDSTAIPEDAQFGKDYFTDPEDHLGWILLLDKKQRGVIEELQGGVIGLHWFRDRLYAVADLVVLELSSSLDGIEGAGVGYDVANPSGESVPVLGIVDDTHIVVPTWNTDSNYLTANGTYIDVLSINTGIVASIFESRTEQQTIDETDSSSIPDFGWRFKHLGWQVPFKDGNSPYGSLTSLQQNKQGIGTLGPTSTADANGSPLILTQNLAIAGKGAQVNGWKTNTSPTTYNLESGAVTYAEGDDSYYVYADMYFYWTADGTATAPGSDGSNLIEYPSTNSVVVTA